MSSSWESLQISDYARLSINPLRKLKFEQTVEPNPNKKAITLQLGDPTIFGNFPPSRETLEAFKSSVDKDSFLYNGGNGRLEAREAVARYAKHQGDAISANDIVLTSGCGHALEMTILTLVSPGENLLVPRPSYNYRTWTDGMHIETRAYRLDPTKSWDIDLDHMESLINDKTRAILVNTPGNPCGNVFSKEHILEILKIAERHKLPIISDEVYEFFTFPGVEFHSVASLSRNVPVLTCSGLTKRFLMPGIRMGWIIIKDPIGVLKNVREGLVNVTGRILGPNSTVQYALPEILKNTPQKFFEETVLKIAKSAATVYDLLQRVEGIQPTKPRGSMYIMVKVQLDKFPMFSTCLEFTERLIQEESVLVFPGSPCFNFPGFFRIVLTVPEDLLIEACERIKEFCKTHIQF